MARGGAKAKQEEPVSPTPFGIGMGEMLTVGWRGFRSNAFALVSGALFTGAALGGTYFAFLSTEGQWSGFFTLLGGLVVSSATALPWYRAALDAYDGVRTPLGSLFAKPGRFTTMLFASVFVWAGIQFGIQYLRAIPSIFVIIMYGFYGFLIAEKDELGAFKALGQSVLLSQGRKMGVAVVAATLALLNVVGVFVAAVGLSFIPGLTDQVGSLALVVGLAALVVTTSWSMVCGAAVYRMLQGRKLDEGT